MPRYYSDRSSGREVPEADNWRYASATDEKVLPTHLDTFSSDQEIKAMQSSHVH